MRTWLFKGCCAPGARMWRSGLVYLLFLAQAIWIGVSDVCGA